MNKPYIKPECTIYNVASPILAASVYDDNKHPQEFGLYNDVIFTDEPNSSDDYWQL